MTKKGKGGGGGGLLGQSLISASGGVRSGPKSGRRERRDRVRERHTTFDGDNGAGKGFTSVLDVSDLAEIMMDAELTGRDFTPVRRPGGPTIVNPTDDMLQRQLTKKAMMRDLSAAERSVLRLPRRPAWNKHMTVDELEAAERNAFLIWRRKLAAVEEDRTERTSKFLTPFEKNLDFWRQLWRVVEKSDTIIQIVDARDPLLFFCEDLIRYVEEMSTEERPKKVLLLLNKADLLPSAMKIRWSKYFASRRIPVIFFSAIEAAVDREESGRTSGAQDEVEENVDDGAEENVPVGGGVPCKIEVEVEESQEKEEEEQKDDGEEGEGDGDVKMLTRPELIAKMRDMMPAWKEEAVRERTEITGGEEGLAGKVHPTDTRAVIGMVGYPNVGKSSTINAIMKEKKVSVSSTPGRTKHFQTLLVDERVMLCDCPGLVFPNFAASQADLITRGVLPIDNMHNAGPAIDVICRSVPKRQFEALYGIKLKGNDANPDFTCTDELLEIHSRARGFINGHDRADHQRSARVILKDYVNGRIVYCTPPPPLGDGSDF